MVDFLQANPQQDPDAIRKAMLLKMFGAAAGAGAMPGTAAGSPSGAPAASMTPAGGPDTGKPAAQPLTTAANANGGAPQPDNKAPAPVLSEADYAKQNPGAAHTPYVEPDLKHRMLEGLFAGLQNFGHDPGAGERMVGSYVGDIAKNEQAEKNYPTQAAADAHQRYMTYAEGQKVPLELQNLQAEIAKRQAEAKAKNSPPPQLEKINIDNPEKPGEPLIADFDRRSGTVYKEGTFGTPQQEAVMGAKTYEKPALEKNLEKITVLGPDGKPHLYGVNAKGETIKDFGVAPQANKESPGDKRTAGELAQVERETRVAVRKAQESYRGAQATANLQREFIQEAKGGNKAAVKIVPLEGALEITTSQGVHRINKTEVEQYGGAGTYWDRIWGAIKGKVLTGQDIPDNVLDDMDKMTQEVEKNAYQRYSDSYDDEAGIAKGYGIDVSKHLPKLSHGGGNAKAGNLPPGWK